MPNNYRARNAVLPIYRDILWCDQLLTASLKIGIIGLQRRLYLARELVKLVALITAMNDILIIKIDTTLLSVQNVL